ncbi:short chain dehydrogenase/reductase [Metarhizium robertsii ARSEF 23]|uniref:Short chain dehydrogenase/reductase n=1 Tax=Metarhizium robertsii (strain ARSEF 23 / ATCC MYA-3075) TaxID=655844 RepID=A0A0B2X8V4_METRA|nr:short chain dehydrogenase/reductase [Metarhizium robertsii ARSEF 23]KHO11323.1 short chain dehydrogenase/reductase [Metarhizium robertsii ARSEF 23]
MKSYNFRQKDNVVSSLCLGNVDIRVGVVFCNYVLGQNTSQHVDDCVFNPRAKERLLWQPLHIELDIPIMVKLGEIADEFHMYDLKEKVSAWMQNKNSRVLPPVASDTSSQKPARGGKPKRSSNAEQPDEDEFTDGETVVLSPQQVQWFDRADRHEMAKSSRH